MGFMDRFATAVRAFADLDRQAVANFLLLVVVLLVVTSLVRRRRKEDPDNGKRESAPVERGIGVVAILALALLADHDQVLFPLAILVIATLITETAYLENLAAIFWDRAWWKAKASPAAKAAKDEADAAAFVATIPQGKAGGLMLTAEVSESIQVLSLAEARERSASYEANALRALAELGVFSPGEVRVGIALTSRDGRQYVADAVAAHGSRHFVVETKLLMVDGNYLNAVGQVRNLVAAYRESLGHKRRRISVRGILVVTRVRAGPPVNDGEVVTVVMSEEGRLTDPSQVRASLGATSQ